MSALYRQLSLCLVKFWFVKRVCFLGVFMEKHVVCDCEGGL